MVSAKAEAFAGLDVGGEVVDVEGLGRGQAVSFDGVMVDFFLGLDGTDFEGEDAAFEVAEDVVGFENPRAVDGVGVGEEDEMVAFGVEFFDDPPHRFVGGEDVLPSVDEMLVVHFDVEDVEGPGDVIFGWDEAAFKVVLSI